MDGICSAILNKIYALGSVGRYYIISSDEFFDAFPVDAERDETELKKSLQSLVTEGYIDIKYSSGNMYCVALLRNFLPEEEPLCAEMPTEVITEKIEARGKPFWAALAGGAIGGVLGGTLTALFALLF